LTLGAPTPGFSGLPLSTLFPPWMSSMARNNQVTQAVAAVMTPLTRLFPLQGHECLRQPEGTCRTAVPHHSVLSHLSIEFYETCSLRMCACVCACLRGGQQATVKSDLGREPGGAAGQDKYSGSRAQGNKGGSLGPKVGAGGGLERLERRPWQGAEGREAHAEARASEEPDGPWRTLSFSLGAVGGAGGGGGCAGQTGGSGALRASGSPGPNMPPS
jgi:hypothetical protein